MLIRLGDSGRAVLAVQQKLGVPLDGHFGTQTLYAVQEFQRRNGLTADGIVGPATLSYLNLSLAEITTKKNTLEKEDFIRAGATLTCHPGMVEAISLKEARGSAFLTDGRPQILFERHQYYRRLAIVRKPGQTQASQTALRNEVAAKYPNICNPNTGGYIGGAAEYDRLKIARSYSDTAGLESASFGLFQVMGFNAVAIGYESVQEFVRLMELDIENHLTSLTRFILHTPAALRAMRSRDFRALALAYNGKNAPQSYNRDIEKFFNQVRKKYE